MARDMAKKAKTDAEFAKRTYDVVGVRVRADSDIHAALEAVAAEGRSKAKYILDATIEKLTKEGYYAP